MTRSVGIVGASGLIGSELAKTYQQLGWRVVRISRRPKRIVNEEWAPVEMESLRGLDVLVNLAGEPVNKRWTSENKRRFHKSRVGLTRRIAQWISLLPAEERPKVWLNASAVGIYGDCGDTPITEQTPPASTYLAQLCQEWEEVAHYPPLPDCRIIHPRIGVALGKNAQAWEKMNTTFSLGIGGKLGSGKQWFPWIHLKDVVAALIFLADHPTARGPYNLVAPESVRNRQFTRTLGEILHRPTFLGVPRFILRLMLGQFSSALLASQHVIPENLEKAGFRWSFPLLKPALKDLL